MQNVRHETLFQKVFEHARGAMDREAPTVMLPSGRGLVRIVQKRHILGANRIPTRGKALACLSVRDGQPESDGNRFSGSSPDGKISQGGVYLSMHAGPMMLEVAHYNKNFAAAVRRGSAVIVLKTILPLLLLDLSSHGNSSLRFLKQLESRSDIRSAIDASPELRGKSLWDLAFAANDYSVSRALGLAAGYCPSIDGIMFKSARTTKEIPKGDNVLLFGSQGKVVSRKLEIESILLLDNKSRNGGPPYEIHHV